MSGLPINEILQGDVLDRLRTLPDCSVNCCVTSPPYWGLRDYGTAKWEGGNPECKHLVRENGEASTVLSGLQGGTKTTGHQQEGFKDNCPRCGAVRVDKQLGLEKTPEEFISKLVAIFREVRRVLRDDGTCWVNLGDSYAGSGKGSNSDGTPHPAALTGKQGTHKRTTDGLHYPQKASEIGLKPKDLCMIPARVAMALQADGWYLRSMIPWVKRNPMPESTTDRPTSSIEYFFLLTKSKKYFYDANAIKKPVAASTQGRGKVDFGGAKGRAYKEGIVETDPNYRNGNEQWGRTFDYTESCKNGRSRRNSDWFFDSWQGLFTDDDGDPLALVVNTSPYKEAHFATFPEKLVEPCILAGCPKEVCPKCGKARARIIVKTNIPDTLAKGSFFDKGKTGDREGGDRTQEGGRFINEEVGWSNCGCNSGFVPGIVLDPFIGSGTTGLVAAKNELSFLGIELNPKYIDMAYRRIITGLEKHLYGKPKRPKAVKESPNA